MSASYSSHISLTHIEEAAARIGPHLHRTPVMTSSLLDAAAGRRLYFKCEHLQKTGSFKARGALNALLQLGPVAGVVTHSSGNHGQALAWAATKLGLRSCVVVPEGTPKTKTGAISAYGAEVVTCAANRLASVETCTAIAEDRGYAVVPSSEDYNSIAGQGTIALEMFEQVPQLDAVLASVSAGGMCSGIGLVAKSRNPSSRVFCVEPLGKDLGRSLAARRRLWSRPDEFLPTIAEAIRLGSIGQIPFPILCDVAEQQVLTVSDADIVEGMKLSYKFLKQTVEAAAGAAVFAGVRADLPSDIQHVGVVLCGGNVDLDCVPWGVGAK